MRRAKVIEWFTNYGHFYDPKWTVKKLKEEAKLLPDTTIFRLEQEAGLQGHQVLWLPPKHCDLNPIELIWAQVKGYIKKNNTTFRMADVRNLANEGIARVTREDWRKACDHVLKVEEEFWRTENLQPAIDPVIVNLDDTEDLENMDSEYEDGNEEQ